MKHYLDTNFILSFVLMDARSSRADEWLRKSNYALVTSIWAEMEIRSLLNRRMRNRDISQAEAETFINRINTWIRTKAVCLDLNAAAGQIALSLASDPVYKLSAADSLHLGIAIAANSILVTFDDRLADAAHSNGYPVIIP